MFMRREDYEVKEVRDVVQFLHFLFLEGGAV